MLFHDHPGFVPGADWEVPVALEAVQVEVEQLPVVEVVEAVEPVEVAAGEAEQSVAQVVEPGPAVGAVEPELAEDAVHQQFRCFPRLYLSTAHPDLSLALLLD